MMTGRLEAIWTKRARGGPMDARLAAWAVPGQGLAGCANHSRTRQVTLIEREVWDRLMAEVGAQAPPSARRANLMVGGISLASSRNRLLRIGEVLLRIAGETRPCEAMDRVAPGLQSAMRPQWGGGAYAQVLEAGSLTVGDAVAWAGHVRPKVLAYITREGERGREVLVFRHAHHPEAGWQVPGGSVEKGESAEAALRREVREETGLSGLAVVGAVARELFYVEARTEWQERNVFHVRTPRALPERWTHVVSSGAEDHGLHFVFSWMPVAQARAELAAGQGEWLASLS